MADDSHVDSVGEEIDAWMAQIGVRPTSFDASAEAARQRIGRLSRVFGRMLEDVAARHDLSVGDLQAMSALHRGGRPCTPSALGDSLGLTSGTISTRLRRLQTAGLVEAVGATDGRSRPVCLTKAGRERWTAATRDRLANERRLFEVLDAAGLRSLNEQLAILLAEAERVHGQVSRHDPVP